MADILGVRTSEYSRIWDHYPLLAEALSSFTNRLNALDRLSGNPGLPDHAHRGTGHNVAETRRETYADLRDLLARIRSLPGYGNFLTSLEYNQLRKAASRGPVAVVTCSPTRCDALIITSDHPIQVVPLTDITTDILYEKAAILVNSSHPDSGDFGELDLSTATQKDVLKILSWLWDNVAEPILDTLGYNKSPADEGPWPRMWWCPVGVFTFLPLHAAGHHDDAHGLLTGHRTVLDRVVSSYTTTLRAMTHASDPHPPSAALGSTLIVPVPEASGVPLPGVQKEAEAIMAAIPKAYLLPNPTHDTVLQALPNYEIAHFTCHGYTNWAEPFNGYLVLNDYQTSPLTVSEINGLNLSASLAYLSACDTTLSPPRLADESIHMTGAFRLAGYQHVIGTLWPIGDKAAAALAGYFYAHLTDGGAHLPDASRAALSLHHATRLLRSRYPHIPAIWASYIHTGV